MGFVFGKNKVRREQSAAYASDGEFWQHLLQDEASGERMAGGVDTQGHKGSAGRLMRLFGASITILPSVFV